MKVGDKRVFKKVGNNADYYPKDGSIVIINSACECGCGGYFIDGFKDVYGACELLPIEPNFTNALTRKLATDFIEEDSKVIETERERVLTLNGEF